jgi:membrane protein YdbS with pleckstrin-like domain
LVRIQHSEVTRGPLQRLFELATVKIYTAGGQQSDLSIPGLTPDEAYKVRDYINKLVREHVEG